MSEEISFARDLAVILISAGVFTIISKALKQPSILGYIVAGLLIGPHIGFYFGISSTEAVHQWSEIGIIFLMFGLGLEFSFKKLLKVGSAVLITSVSKFFGVFILGFIAGMAMSWSTMESIFLGGLLSMSSTTVIIKSFDEMGLKRKPYSQIVFGTIIIEDLIAILLMVLLSSLAVSNRFAGGEMLFNLGKLAFFLILWFLVGIYLIPTLLKKASKYINDEILLIVSIGLCFTMVTFAEGVGFSSALGAFVMGSILAETIQSERIEKLLTPIKDLFGVVFFVSVGMMLSPSVVIEHWATVLIITIVVLIADIIFVTIGVIVSGKGLENAVHSGFSLAQLGEFGFIIAGVGCSLGVMREFIYPVIIAVSVITTFTAPYMIRLADPAYRLLKRVLPQRLLERIDREERPVATKEEQSKWKQVLKVYFLRIILYGVVIIAIDIATKLYLESLLVKIFPSIGQTMLKAVDLSVTLILILPFIYGMAANTGSGKQILSLLKEDRKNALPVLGLILLQSFLSMGAVLGVISARVHLSAWVIPLLFIGGVLIILVARHYLRKYTLIEKHFIANLNEKERMQMKMAPVTTAFNDSMKGYDVHIESIVMPQNSTYVGHRLRTIPLRRETGASIIKITRGEESIVIPSGEVRLYPFDRILAVGTTQQLEKLRALFDDSVNIPEKTVSDDNFIVEPVSLDATSVLTGRKLGESAVSQYQCMVVSVMREGVFTANPRASFCFLEGDTVWLAGDKTMISNFLSSGPTASTGQEQAQPTA